MYATEHLHRRLYIPYHRGLYGQYVYALSGQFEYVLAFECELRSLWGQLEVLGLQQLLHEQVRYEFIRVLLHNRG